MRDREPERGAASRGRGPSRFRQRDVAAAVKAVRATGERVAGVEIAPNGSIRVIVAAGDALAEARNPWDDED